MELLNKITTKSIGVQPKQGVTDPDANGKSVPCARVFDLEIGPTTIPVARIFGRASSCKSKTSDYGESFQFSGNFEATRLSDGETFRSPKLFLPKVLEGLMAEALQNSEEALDFVVEIGVKASNNAHHYEWSVKPLMESQQADQLAHLRQAATANLQIGLDKPAEPVHDTPKTKKSK